MSFFHRDDDSKSPNGEAPATAPHEADAPAPRPTSERAIEVNNTKRIFDPSVADFSDTERAKRLYAERGQTPPTH